MERTKNQGIEITRDIVEAIKTFPLQREVRHCGITFAVPGFDLYAPCPQCGAEIKLRSFAAVPEVEDVFDAVLEWMLQPGAEEIARRRQAVIADDQDE